MPLEKTKNIILSHEGYLDFEVIGNLIGKLQQIMKEEGERVNVYKKILTVMIESLENAYKYCSDLDLTTLPEKQISRFYLTHEEQTYTLKVTNPILNKDVEKVTKLLDYINSLDQAGLRKLYRDTITDGKFNTKGGAGLGFIEMAKLACDKLHYQVEDLDKGFKLFTLTIRIN